MAIGPSVLQHVEVCHSVLQCVAVCCSVSRCVTVYCSARHSIGYIRRQDDDGDRFQSVAVSCSVMQCVAACCSVLQCAAVCCSVLQHVAVWCSALHSFGRIRRQSDDGNRFQCVAVCCSVLQCVAVCRRVSLCVALCSQQCGVVIVSTIATTHCNTLQHTATHCNYCYNTLRSKSKHITIQPNTIRSSRTANDSAPKAFWNPAGVEPVHWKLAPIDPGFRVSGTSRESDSVRS